MRFVERACVEISCYGKFKNVNLMSLTTKTHNDDLNEHIYMHRTFASQTSEG